MNRTIDQDEIGHFVALWRLEPAGEPFATHCSVLVPAMQDGAPVMLKLTAEPDEIRGGGLLAWWNGRGAVPVLEFGDGALLMERPTGEQSLFDMALAGHDDSAIEVLCQVVAKLHQPGTRPLPPLATLEELFEPLLRSASTDDSVQTGKTLVVELLSSQVDLRPLHGDMHHRNVLSSGDGRWLAIDPKGLFGERAFDYVNLFRNPTSEIALSPERFERRMETVTRTAGLDPLRLARWVAAFCALALVWDYYPEGTPEADRALAQLALTLIARPARHAKSTC